MSHSTFLLTWRKYFSYVKIPKNQPFTKCTKCVKLAELIQATGDPNYKAALKARREEHWQRVTKERLVCLEAAIVRSRVDPDFLFCEIDSMDQAKTILPHMVVWDKDIDKNNLLQVVVTAVKYNGTRPDDVYTYNNTFPHDSAATCTVMYLTVLKVTCGPFLSLVLRVAAVCLRHTFSFADSVEC